MRLAEALQDWELASEYSSLQIDASNVECMPTNTPEEIVKTIKEGKIPELHGMAKV